MRFTRTALAAAVMTTAPAAGDVTSVSAVGFVSRNSIEVKATPREVWETLVAPGRWWNDEHTYSGDAANMSMDARAGGCFLREASAGGWRVIGRRRAHACHLCRRWKDVAAERSTRAAPVRSGKRDADGDAPGGQERHDANSLGICRRWLHAIQAGRYRAGCRQGNGRPTWPIGREGWRGLTCGDQACEALAQGVLRFLTCQGNCAR